MEKYFGTNGSWPEAAKMTIADTWPRLDRGGVEMIREWCRAMTNPTLVTIDVLKNVRPVASNGKRDYDADYEALSGLKPLVQEFPGLSIMGAHPDRKMAADDVFDTFSGTLGLTGVVDCLAILKREKCIGGTTLNIRGRDTSGDVQKAVKFDVETCRWQVLGEASEVNQFRAGPALTRGR